jgi:hypothetical protein
MINHNITSNERPSVLLLWVFVDWLPLQLLLMLHVSTVVCSHARMHACMQFTSNCSIEIAKAIAV